MAKIKPTLEEFRPDSRLVDERPPTRERAAKAGEHIFHDDLGRRYMRDSPIETAFSRKQISGAQYTASQKYYSHCFHGGLMGGMKSADLSMVFAGFGPREGLAANVGQLFHRDRVAQAGRLMGKRGWVLDDIIIRECSFEATGRRMGWNNRPQAVAAAVTEARALLDSLCNAWGIFE